MRNIRYNIVSSNGSISTIILLTIVLILMLSIVLIVIYLMKKEQMFEKFEDKKSASESVSEALINIIKSANKIGKKMLNPEVWSERLNLINKSPMELARMHIGSK